LDSAVRDDAVATQDTVTQLIAGVRRVRRVGSGVAEVIAACHAHDWDDPGKPRIAWDDKAARDALVSTLVNDANTLRRGRRWRIGPDNHAAVVGLCLLDNDIHAGGFEYRAIAHPTTLRS